ncbi:PDR/VanB family oxidoreductase [Corynebacterium sp. AOP36-E1-14]|uniref:PDR/VanB family oxidoreductase n=2 Tax=Corynebacterium TaxID=1716 RepID=UPI0040340D77
MMNKLTVVARRSLTPRVDEFTLALPDGAPLPGWTPGSHVDVSVPGSGLTRQYSLCSRPSDPSSYTVAVDRQDVASGGRGGSAGLHRDAGVGTPVLVGAPRNHFPLTRALNYVFVAGGVGVTPMVSLVAEAQRSGRPWRMLCLARTEADMPYLAQLRDEYDDCDDHGPAGSGRIRFHGSAQAGRLDLAAALADLPRGTAVYVCGPGHLADDVATAVADQPAVDVFAEQFTAPDLSDGTAASFDVTLATSGETVTVAPDASLLDTLEAHGALLASSCREGVCGTCEVGVVSGEVDHRDNVLTPEERSENESMMVCVSRCRSGRLVLDL